MCCTAAAAVVDVVHRFALGVDTLVFIAVIVPFTRAVFDNPPVVPAVWSTQRTRQAVFLSATMRTDDANSSLRTIVVLLLYYTVFLV